jgi:hypothetical protein
MMIVKSRGLSFINTVLGPLVSVVNFSYGLLFTA